MSDPTQFDDYVSGGLGDLLIQYQGATKFRALLESYLERLQELENTAYEVLLGIRLEVATGDALQKLAKLVGLGDVDSLTEEALRARIAAQLIINRSNGHGDDLLTAARALVGDAELITIVDSPPAQAILAITPIPVGNPTGDPDTIFELLNSMAPAGVRLFLLYSEQLLANTFAYSDLAGLATTDSNRGYGNVAQTLGGYYAGVITE